MKIVMRNLKYSSGIALIQVLLISAVLSLMAVQLNKSAKVNTALTSGFSDKTNALVLMRDAESILFYKLLSRDDEQLSNLEDLNYYGETFQFNDHAIVTLQDTAGLINLHYPNRNLIRRWALFNNLSEEKADSIYGQLIDWQDKDAEVSPYGAESEAYISRGTKIANINLSSPLHLLYLLDIGNDRAKSLAEISTVYGYTALNPYHFPNELLLLNYGRNIAEDIIGMRQEKNISHKMFSQRTGDNEDEDKSFAISPYLNVLIEVSYGNAIVSKSSTVELVPFFKGGQAAISKLKTTIH